MTRDNNPTTTGISQGDFEAEDAIRYALPPRVRELIDVELPLAFKPSQVKAFLAHYGEERTIAALKDQVKHDAIRAYGSDYPSRYAL